MVIKDDGAFRLAGVEGTPTSSMTGSFPFSQNIAQRDHGTFFVGEKPPNVRDFQNVCVQYSSRVSGAYLYRETPKRITGPHRNTKKQEMTKP